jgi:exosortase
MLHKDRVLSLKDSSSLAIVLMSLGVIWWLAIRLLWNEWEIDPQYSYGFLVPILCVALFALRWSDRPRQQPGLQTIWLAAVPGLIVLAAIQPLFEANPEWRVLGVAGSFCAVGLTFCLLLAVGGKAWVQHFAFPVLFFLIAVPWPRNLEESIMSWLMQHNAMAALEVLHWLGFEATRSGNLISLPGGTIGIEEACSGVRSLQSGIMTALFLGEIFRFRIFTRCVLLCAAIGVALLGNFMRSTTLAIIASNKGIAELEKWHDIAGYIILALTLGALWGFASWRNKVRLAAKPLRTLAPPPARFSMPPFFVRYAIAIIATGGVALTGTEWWFRSHEAGMEIPPKWTIASGGPGTKAVSINERTMRMLFFPDGFSERFLDDQGNNWQFFYLRWPKGRTAIQAMSIHDPRTCLASIGMVLESVLPSITINANGIRFPFRIFLFRDRGRPVLVFHATVADGWNNLDFDKSPSGGQYTLQGRWNNLKAGIRNRGQIVMEAAVWNTSNVKAATLQLQRFLESSLRIEHKKSRGSDSR